MTNEQAKQEAIRKAWGNNYELVKNYLEAKGFFINNDNLSYLTIGLDFSGIEMEWIGNYYRPIVLKGISDNNGWVRIEEDGSNLPIPKGLAKYRVGILTKIKFIIRDDMDARNLQNEHFNGFATHYKPITPELKPIY